MSVNRCSDKGKTIKNREARCWYEELKYIYPEFAQPDERTPEEKKRDAEKAKIELFGPEENE